MDGPVQSEEAPKGISFAVSPVKSVNAYLNDTFAITILEEKIGKEIFILPEELNQQRWVYAKENGLVDAIHFAYDGHRPLVLSPDDIWLTLCQGFCIHLNQNHSELSSRIFKPEKPEFIKIRNDSLVTLRPEQWASLVNELSKGVEAFTQGAVRDFMVPGFSTTTPQIQTAYEVNLLESFRQDFVYYAESGCGIPRITLTGETKDWEWIYANVERFREFGLDKWVDNLKPILHEFVNASKGNADKKFWEGTYKEASIYMSTLVSGWIVKLFPYVKKFAYAGEEEGKWYFEPNPYFEGELHFLSTLEKRSFPGGISNTEIIWINHLAQSVDTLTISAGFMGIRQYADYSLEPVITWAVSKKSSESIWRDLHAWSEKKPEHDIGVVPGVEKPDSGLGSIYCPEMNKTQMEGNEMLKNYLQSELKNLFQANGETDSIRIDFVVTYSGTIAEVQCSKVKYLAKVSELLSNLPCGWRPGKVLKPRRIYPAIPEALINEKIVLNLFDSIEK